MRRAPRYVGAMTTETTSKRRARGPQPRPAPAQGSAGAAKTPTQVKRATKAEDQSARPRETGGSRGPEPTRYGDWERNGRCIDF